MERITIPYAVADFIDLRERKFYYVDKTSLPVTTIAPRPIVSRNCSAALGSGNTRRRNIAAT